MSYSTLCIITITFSSHNNSSHCIPTHHFPSIVMGPVFSLNCLLSRCLSLLSHSSQPSFISCSFTSSFLSIIPFGLSPNTQSKKRLYLVVLRAVSFLLFSSISEIDFFTTKSHQHGSTTPSFVCHW